MGDTEKTTFIPVLTVMVDYGNAPFLWLVSDPTQRGIGPNWVDGSGWGASYPMSYGLWRKFADWAIEFDRTSFFSDDFNADDWDWPAFHERGLQLSRLLKEEVGGAYRVIYDKPVEDPNQEINERTEILADGSYLPHPPYCSPVPASALPICNHIISGGQTGADRGALDFAMRHRYTHGGWVPHGRLAEDGVIPVKYQLTELTEGGYRQRTRRNVEDSDATLIINLGELDGGTLATRVFAEKSGKPCLVVQVDEGLSETMVETVINWLDLHKVNILNVAGPRESKRPGIYRSTIELLTAVEAIRRPPQE